MNIEPAAQDDAIAFQGEPGAYSHLACKTVFADRPTLPCPTFEDTLTAVETGEAELAMVPVENSLAGRVSEIHHLIPHASLHIIGEHFQPIHHHLLGIESSTIEQVITAHSHEQALGQCRRTLKTMGIHPKVEADTAGAALRVSQQGDTSQAAIASSLAGEIYGLKTLKMNLEDAPHNTTRFLIMSRSKRDLPVDDEPVMTSFIFEVRNIPAALYKALGGFATNGVNMTRLESYQPEGNFLSTQFYADVEGHPDHPGLLLALEELEFFSIYLKILGTYPRSSFRDSRIL